MNKSYSPLALSAHSAFLCVFAPLRENKRKDSDLAEAQGRRGLKGEER